MTLVSFVHQRTPLLVLVVLGVGVVVFLDIFESLFKGL